MFSSPLCRSLCHVYGNGAAATVGLGAGGLESVALYLLSAGAGAPLGFRGRGVPS